MFVSFMPDILQVTDITTKGDVYKLQSSKDDSTLPERAKEHFEQGGFSFRGGVKIQDKHKEWDTAYWGKSLELCRLLISAGHIKTYRDCARAITKKMYLNKVNMSFLTGVRETGKAKRRRKTPAARQRKK